MGIKKILEKLKFRYGCNEGGYSLVADLSSIFGISIIILGLLLNLHSLISYFGTPVDWHHIFVSQDLKVLHYLFCPDIISQHPADNETVSFVIGVLLLLFSYIYSYVVASERPFKTKKDAAILVVLGLAVATIFWLLLCLLYL